MAASAGTFVLAHAGSGTSLTSSSIGTTTVGDVLVLSTSDGNNGADPTGADSQTNTGWGQLGTAQVETTTGMRMTVLYTQNIANAGAGHSITANYGSANNISLLAGFITGTAGAGAVDTGSLAQVIDTTTAYQVTSNAPAQTDNYVLTWFGIDDTGAGTDTFVQPSGYALLQKADNHSTSYCHAVAGLAVNSGSGQSVTWASNVTTGDRQLKIVHIKSLAAAGTGEEPPKKSAPRQRQSITFDFTAAGWFNTQAAGISAFDRDMAYPVGAAAYTLTADAGTFALTGVAAALRAARTLTAASGTFALTGNAANLLYGRKLAAGAGSFALTGNDATFPRTYRLAAAAGAYALTGNSAGLVKGFSLTASAGSFALTGIAAGLRRAVVLSAGTGSYALSGQPASFPLTRRLAAESGSYALTGFAALLLSARTLQAGAGVYALTGNSAGLLKGYRLAAEAGSFVLSGQPAGLNVVGSITLVAGSGSFALTGGDAGLRADRKLSAEAGGFSLAGQAANLLHDSVIQAGQGAFDLTGNAAGLNIGRLIQALSGSFVLSGKPANLNYSAGIDYGAIAAAVWAYVLPNGKTAAETVVETLALVEALSTAPSCLEVAIEGPYTGADLLRVIAAVQAGKSDITALGAGAATVEFRAVDDSEVRVTADMNGSERTEVTLNAN